MADERSVGGSLERTRNLELGKPAKWTLGLVGIGCMGVGGFAVFTTENVLGTLALLLIGAALVLTAIVGIMPIRLKIGDNEIIYEAHTASYVERAQESLAETIGRPEVSLAVRQTVSDTIVDFNEQFMAQAGVVPQFARHLAMQAYRTSVLGALRRTLPDAEVVERSPGFDVQYDFVVKMNNRELHVDCALGLKRSSGPMPSELVRYIIDRGSAVERVLVVCNRPPIEPAWERITEGQDQMFRRRALPHGIAIVKWTSIADDNSIATQARLLLDIEFQSASAGRS